MLGIVHVNKPYNPPKLFIDIPLDSQITSYMTHLKSNSVMMVMTRETMEMDMPM